MKKVTGPYLPAPVVFGWRDIGNTEEADGFGYLAIGEGDKNS